MEANKATADELLDKGIDFYNKGKWSQALECWERVNGIYEELGDKKGISTTLNSIGLVYQNKGEWGRAREYYEKSLRIAEELGDKLGISTTLNNIGEINIKNGDLDEAENNLKRSLAIAEELAPISTVVVLANLSELWRFDDRYDVAFTTLEKALQIVIHTGAKPQEIDIIEKLS